MKLTPMDQHNWRLLNHVAPANWQPAKPQAMYNLVVVGAGTAGLISALGCAALGGKVALVEQHLMGGDCLNVGCVPSKSLLRSSRLAYHMAQAQKFGLTPHAVDDQDFVQVMERLRRIRADISIHDSAARYRELGVDVFFGTGVFVGRHTLQVNDVVLNFRKAIIATGARPVVPGIAGLDQVRFFTNETIFNLTQLPQRLTVLGGGPIGCELAQAFNRLGSKVTVVSHNHVLSREDSDVSDLLAGVFHSEGIICHINAVPMGVSEDGGEQHVIIRQEGRDTSVISDVLMVAVGRQPNVENLGLDAVEVAFDQNRGIRINDFLQTTHRDIYAAGDVCMDWKFTHAADAAARIAIANALFRGRRRLSRLTMPWCTYTDPEVARVGLNEREAQRFGLAVDQYQVDLSGNDRAVVDGENNGLVKILVKKGTDRIVGATIVAAHAGEMISELSVAMAGGLGLAKLANVIHPYPTQAEAIRRAALNYQRTRLTPRIAKVLRWWLKWRRG